MRLQAHAHLFCLNFSTDNQLFAFLLYVATISKLCCTACSSGRHDLAQVSHCLVLRTRLISPTGSCHDCVKSCASLQIQMVKAHKHVCRNQSCCYSSPIPVQSSRILLLRELHALAGRAQTTRHLLSCTSSVARQSSYVAVRFMRHLATRDVLWSCVDRLVNINALLRVQRNRWLTFYKILFCFSLHVSPTGV